MKLYLLMQLKPQLNDLKKQKHFYSGKKKRHTLKTQIIVDKKKKLVVCTSFTNGKRHDFRLFKESGVHVHPIIRSLTDTGYQGIQRPFSPDPKVPSATDPELLF